MSVVFIKPMCAMTKSILFNTSLYLFYFKGSDHVQETNKQVKERVVGTDISLKQLRLAEISYARYLHLKSETRRFETTRPQLSQIYQKTKQFYE